MADTFQLDQYVLRPQGNTLHICETAGTVVAYVDDLRLSYGENNRIIFSDESQSRRALLKVKIICNINGEIDTCEITDASTDEKVGACVAAVMGSGYKLLNACDSEIGTLQEEAGLQQLLAFFTCGRLATKYTIRLAGC